MQRSSDRILTTHTGSLPRSPKLLELIFAHEEGRADEEALEAGVREEVMAIVRKQRECGVDVINDGEVSKIGYTTYVKERLTGFEGDRQLPYERADVAEFPDWAEQLARQVGAEQTYAHTSACTGPIAVKDRDKLRRDIDNLKSATQGVDAAEVFMSAASPGVVAALFPNEYYPTREEYVSAIADAMQEEYEAIAAAGIVLQLDAPDLAMTRSLLFADKTLGEFRKEAQLNVEALNHATRNVDPERMRMHLCWGNYPGPHSHDVPLRDIVDIVLSARPNAIALEACNPRHVHEWKVFEDVKLPDEKVLIPGVVDSTSNYIEHPEAVAQRLENYGRIVGMERVLAGTDCGFGTFAGLHFVAPSIVWAKFRAMAQGAELATQALRK